MICRKALRELERGVRSLRRKIDAVRARLDRDKERRGAGVWLERALPQFRQMKEKVLNGYAYGYDLWHGGEPAEPEPQAQSAAPLPMRAAATVTFTLAALFAALKGYQSYYLTKGASAIVGLAVATMVAVAIYGLGAFVASNHERTPREAVARLKYCLWPLGVICLAALTCFLGVGDHPRLVDLSVTVFAVSAPILSGVMLTLADLLGWSDKYVRMFRRLRRLEVHLDELGTIVHGGAAVNETHRQAPRGAAAASATVVTLMLIMLPYPTQAQPAAQPMTAGGTVALAPEATPPVTARGPAAQAWWDVSRSADAETRRVRLEQFFEVAPLLTNQGINRWELFRFDNDAFEASPAYVWSLEPFRPKPCAPPEYTKLEKVLAGMKADADKRWAKYCQDYQTNQRMAFEQGQREGVIKARGAVLAPQTGDHCTALRELLGRISTITTPSGQFVTIYTDGEETCEANVSKPIPAPKRSVHVVMVIVPVAGTKVLPGAHFKTRESYWSRIAPWVKVVPGSEFGPAMFDDED